MFNQTYLATQFRLIVTNHQDESPGPITTTEQRVLISLAERQIKPILHSSWYYLNASLIRLNISSSRKLDERS